MIFTPTEIERYSRQIQLNEIGHSGQVKLKAAKVLVVGAGGLGCPVLLYLSSAGIGTIGIIDSDEVAESNLHRQVLFNTRLIGENKALAAKEQLQALNPFVKFNAYAEKLDHQNAESLFEKYDIIVDATDNFSSRYLINDASVLTNKPTIYGAIHGFEGQVSVFNYKNGPTYRCLFPNPPSALSIPNCDQMGVLGTLPGIVGCYQANETLKVILKLEETLSRKLLLINTLKNSHNIIQIKRMDDEVRKVQSLNKLSDTYRDSCYSTVKQISSKKVEEMLNTGVKLQLLDVRSPEELPHIKDWDTLKIPSNEIESRYQEIDREVTTVVFCQSGIRSSKVIHFLQEKLGYTHLLNLKGGVKSWQKNHDKVLNPITNR